MNSIDKLLGIVTVSFGFLAFYMFYSYPERLEVPFSIGTLVCICFVLSGAILLFRSFGFNAFCDWLVVLLLLTMITIPAWLAIGSGSRQCSSNVPYFSGETSCRIVFGVSALFVLPLLLLALSQAMRKKES